MLYSYKPAQASACLDTKPIVFIGDSVTRKLYFQLANLLDPALPTAAKDGQRHVDHTLHAKNGSDISFFWDPFLNNTNTLDILRSARDTAHRPALLVLGSGLWYLRYANDSGGLPSWEANMERILDEVVKSPIKPADEVVILPVEQVVASKLSQERAPSMRASDIEAMNSDLFHRLSSLTSPNLSRFYNKPTLPLSLPLVFNQMLDPSQTEDGLHFSDALIKIQANIILNLRCNNAMPKQFPLDKTCCNTYPSPNWLHLAILVFTILWGPFMMLISNQTGMSKS